MDVVLYRLYAWILVFFLNSYIGAVGVCLFLGGVMDVHELNDLTEGSPKTELRRESHKQRTFGEVVVTLCRGPPKRRHVKRR